MHDFAFFRFDPSKVKHMELVELPLAPAEAELAAEIVIIGNNAGERCSIHRTTLARTDRNAPAYGRNNYNDFNTFYFHSASGTSGGSSGSPVLNVDGKAIALNAGGKAGTSAGFFLPLDRAARALALLQADEPVPRGTLQAVCLHQPFDEASRLGLPADTEAELRARQPSLRGVLVLSERLPEGPAAAALEVGDILLKVGGEWCTSFVDLEAALDDSVGGSVALTVCRGGAAVERTVRVDDLHALTPSRYIEFGGAVLNELSYQQARNHAMAVKGVYVAHPGYSLRLARVTKGSVICAAGHEETPDLDSLLRVIRAAPHGSRLSLRFYDVNNQGTRSALVAVGRPQVAPARRQPTRRRHRHVARSSRRPRRRRHPRRRRRGCRRCHRRRTAATAASAATASTAADGAAALGEVQAAAAVAAGAPPPSPSTTAPRAGGGGPSVGQPVAVARLCRLHATVLHRRRDGHKVPRRWRAARRRARARRRRP